jgi:tetratricopeptide (TPR) repeat protein
MKNLSTVAFAMGSYNEAQEMAQGALRTFQTILGNSDANETTASILADLGQICLKLGQLVEAIDYFKEAVQARTILSGKNDRRVGVIQMYLAKALSEMSRYEDSNTMYYDALRILGLHQNDSSLSASNKDALNLCLMELAALKRKMGLFAAAQELYERCLQNRINLFGDESEEVAATLFDMSELYKQLGDLPYAKDAVEECARIRSIVYGLHGMKTAMSLRAAGMISLMLGDGEEALVLLRECMNILQECVLQAPTEKGLSAMSRKDNTIQLTNDLIVVMESIARILTEKSQFDEASNLLERCLELRRGIYGDDHGDVAKTLHLLGDISFKRGNYDEAKEIHSIGLGIRTKVFGGNDMRTVASKISIARCQLELHEVVGARSLVEGSINAIKDRYGEETLYMAVALHLLARCSLMEDELDDALMVESKAQDILMETCGKFNASVSDSHVFIGDIHRTKGNVSMARSCYAQALGIERAVEHSAEAGAPTQGTKSPNYKGVKKTNRKSLYTRYYVRYYDISFEQLLDGKDCTSTSGAFITMEQNYHRMLRVYERLLWALDRQGKDLEADAFAEELQGLYQTAFGAKSLMMASVLKLLATRKRMRPDFDACVHILTDLVDIQEAEIIRLSTLSDDAATLAPKLTAIIEDVIRNLGEILELQIEQGLASAGATQNKLDQYCSILNPDGTHTEDVGGHGRGGIVGFFSNALFGGRSSSAARGAAGVLRSAAAHSSLDEGLLGRSNRGVMAIVSKFSNIFSG